MMQKFSNRVSEPYANASGRTPRERVHSCRERTSARRHGAGAAPEGPIMRAVWAWMLLWGGLGLVVVTGAAAGSIQLEPGMVIRKDTRVSPGSYHLGGP